LYFFQTGAILRLVSAALVQSETSIRCVWLTTSGTPNVLDARNAERAWKRRGPAFS